MSTNQPIKSEEGTTPAPSATPTPAPAPAAPYSWPATSIPIDPALQQQSQPGTPAPTTTAYQYSHYQHYPYYGQYAAVPPPTTAVAQPRTAAPATASTSTAATNQAGSSSGGGGEDLATLNDALGSAGVDLRAEEETLQRSSDHHLTYRSYEDRTRKQPPKPSFDTHFLSQTIRSLSTPHKITRVPDDSINYLALALRIRLQDLLVSMINAAKHRTNTQFDRPASVYDEDGSPMWSILVQKDVAKQLTVIEKVEREEELRIRRERKERADMAAAHAAALAAQANAALSASGAGSSASGAGFGDGFDDDGGARKKRKKEGPGVTARNMSEDVRKKMSNAVASQAAGLGGRYSWMTAANANSAVTPVKKDKPATPAPAATTTPAAMTSTSTSAGTPAAGTATATGSPAIPTATNGWARPYVGAKKTASPSTEAVEEDTRLAITMRDAMFVIRNERGHGGGRGAARGWT